MRVTITYKVSQANLFFLNSLTPNLQFAMKQVVHDTLVISHDGIIVVDAATSSATFILFTGYLLIKTRITIQGAQNAVRANIAGMITVVGSLHVRVAPTVRAQMEIQRLLQHP